VGGLRRSTIEFLQDGTTNTTVGSPFLLGQRELHPNNMTSSKNSSTASRQRPGCDQCSQTFINTSKLRRHKREQHAKRKTCPWADCKYKGTKRMGLLIGQGTHPGHLEKKHGLDREGMPNKLPISPKRNRLLTTVLAAARIVREHEEQILDTSANSAHQGAFHPQGCPQIVYNDETLLIIHWVICSALHPSLQLLRLC
jgi:hypothetical protein